MRVLNRANLIIFLLLSTVIACSDNGNTKLDNTYTKLSVYKNPQCGCCNKWITHLEKSGFQIDTGYLDAPEVNALKSEIKNVSKYLSCHTGVYLDKYIFEGHIPAKFITQFLSETPEGALGLAVPGMPVGSPGMEVDNKFTPYDILLINNNGTHEVYAHIDNYEEQF